MPRELNKFTLRKLNREFKILQEEPVEGFLVKLADERDLTTWEVTIFGPPNTLYEGGYFKALMTFPDDYPLSPPTFRFLNKIWHPNVYRDGRLCISILHPQFYDPLLNELTGEPSNERWNPMQNARTILLSIISLLDEPNANAPANVDAAIMYRKWKNSEGMDKEYEEIIRKQVLESKEFAKMDNVTIPITVEEYCIKTVIADDNTDDSSNEFYEIYDLDDESDDEETSEDSDERQVERPNKRRKV